MDLHESCYLMSIPVASDVRLVTDASQSNAVKLSAQSLSYGASHTGLTDPRGPHKAKDGALKAEINMGHITEIPVHFLLNNAFLLHRIHHFLSLYVKWTERSIRSTFSEVFSCLTARYSSTRLFSFSMA